MKILSGYGKLYFANWEYKPVPGDRKSGIPAAVDRPAPVITTILFARRERKPLKKTAGMTQKTRYFFKKSFSLKSHWWVLKNFAKVSNKFIWSTSSLVRLQVCASNFHKKRLRHGCASGNFVKYFESDNNIHMPAFRNVFPLLEKTLPDFDWSICLLRMTNFKKFVSKIELGSRWA